MIPDPVISTGFAMNLKTECILYSSSFTCDSNRTSSIFILSSLLVLFEYSTLTDSRLFHTQNLTSSVIFATAHLFIFHGLIIMLLQTIKFQCGFNNIIACHKKNE